MTMGTMESPVSRGRALFVKEQDIMGESMGTDELRALQKTEIEVIKFLGSGGEGKVYLGKVMELDQLVAFKQFQICNNPEQGKHVARGQSYNAF